MCSTLPRLSKEPGFGAQILTALIAHRCWSPSEVLFQWPCWSGCRRRLRLEDNKEKKNVTKNLWLARPGSIVGSFEVVCEWPDREFLVITMTGGAKLEVELVWGASDVTGRIKEL